MPFLWIFPQRGQSYASKKPCFDCCEFWVVWSRLLTSKLLLRRLLTGLEEPLEYPLESLFPKIKTKTLNELAKNLVDIECHIHNLLHIMLHSFVYSKPNFLFYRSRLWPSLPNNICFVNWYDRTLLYRTLANNNISNPITSLDSDFFTVIFFNEWPQHIM